VTEINHKELSAAKPQPKGRRNLTTKSTKVTKVSPPSPGEN
jgi:hypothetical protein